MPRDRSRRYLGRGPLEKHQRREMTIWRPCLHALNLRVISTYQDHSHRYLGPLILSRNLAHRFQALRQIPFFENHPVPPGRLRKYSDPCPPEGRPELILSWPLWLPNQLGLLQLSLLLRWRPRNRRPQRKLHWSNRSRGTARCPRQWNLQNQCKRKQSHLSKCNPGRPVNSPCLWIVASCVRCCDPTLPNPQRLNLKARPGPLYRLPRSSFPILSLLSRRCPQLPHPRRRRRLPQPFPRATRANPTPCF